MVAAGLGFAFMPVNLVKHPGVIGLPVVEPEFWRQVSLVSVRGRRYSPGVGSLVREATRKAWFDKQPQSAVESEDALQPAASYAAE
jgi:LysR family transcriptional regulator, hydrogen peroxide-inducible genes activator